MKTSTLIAVGVVGLAGVYFVFLRKPAATSGTAPSGGNPPSTTNSFFTNPLATLENLGNNLGTQALQTGITAGTGALAGGFNSLFGSGGSSNGDTGTGLGDTGGIGDPGPVGSPDVDPTTGLIDDVGDDADDLG